MCMEGDFAQNMLATMANFAHSYFTAASDIAQAILVTWTTIWMAWSLLGLAIGRPQDPKQLVETLLATILANSLLVDPELIWQFVDMLTSITVYAGGKAISINTTAAQPADVGTMVCYAMGGIDNAFGNGLTSMLLDGTSVIGRLIMIALLWFLEGFLLFKVLKALVDPMIGMFGLFVLLPFIVALVPPEATRRSGFVTIKLLFSNAFEMTIACSVTGVFMAMVNTIASGMPIKPNGALGQSEDWLASPSYWFILWAMALFYFSFDRLMQLPVSLLEIITANSQWRVPLLSKLTR